MLGLMALTIPVVAVLGIIVGVGALFMTTMMRSYFVSRQGVEIAQVAEIAVDRMVYELKNAKGQGGGNTVGVTPNTNVTFESNLPDLTGTRSIQLSGSNLVLDVDNTDYLLLPNINSFTLNVTEADTDGDPATGPEISSFNISFTVTGSGATYNLQVSPREFLEATP